MIASNVKTGLPNNLIDYQPSSLICLAILVMLKTFAGLCRFLRQSILAAVPLFVAFILIGIATSASADDGLFIKSKRDGRQCNYYTLHKAYMEAAASCGSEADDFHRMALAKDVPPETVSTLFIGSAFAHSFQSYALAHAGDNNQSRHVFELGQAILGALIKTPGCKVCAQHATEALRQYGTWPVTDERRFKQ